MTPLKIGKSLLAAALIAPAPALAANSETKLSVTTTPNPVSEKESVQLQIVVDAPLATTVPEPTFDAPDFAQTGARDMRFQSYSDEFGPNTRKKLIFTYVLMPRQEGNFLVRNIQTKVAGQTIS